MLLVELVDLGIHHPDYFQGFGTSFTNFEHSVVGCGDNPREALDDAIEQIAGGGFGVDIDELERAICEWEEWESLEDCPDSPSAYQEGEDTEFAPYYYVGIRWKKTDLTDWSE